MKVLIRSIQIARVQDPSTRDYKLIDVREWRNVSFEVPSASGSVRLEEMQLPVEDCNFLKVGDVFDLRLLPEES